MIKKLRYLAHDIMRYNYKNYNFRLVFYVIVLSIIGILAIESAADGYANKQTIGVCIGLAGMAVCSFISYNYIAKFKWLLYAASIALLTGVLFLGKTVNGSTRWFSLGSFGTLQPSELAKIMIIIIFAKFINDNKDRINKLSTLLVIGALYALPIILILMETDLSTSFVFVFIFCVLLFVGGLSFKIIGATLIAIIPTFALLIWYIQQPEQILLKDYQLARILTFLNPSDYLLTTFTQQYNSVMAIGSGMLTGKGLNNNTLTSVKGGNFISEPQTDFIFAVIGEELGFIGGLVVIGLLLLIVIECLLIAKDAYDLTGRLIACSVAGMFAFQAFINIGVATALLPNTGLPLPFISYGLSSLLSNMLGVGLVLNVGLQRNRR